MTQLVRWVQIFVPDIILSAASRFLSMIVSMYPPLIQSGIGLRRNRVEQKEALRTCQELLEAQRDVSVSIRIVLLEDVGHSLQTDASLHE